MKNRVAGTCALVAGIALFGCAGSKVAGPGVVSPASSTTVPVADLIPSYPLVKDEPSILSATRKLDAAGDAARPPLLLARVKEAIAAAQKIRAEQGTLISLTALAPGHEQYLAYYDLAYRDLKDIVERYPKTSEAPLAQYLLGLIHDYPHLDLFEDALVEYRIAVESYPDTSWAKQAADRIRTIEEIMRRALESTHGM